MNVDRYGAAPFDEDDEIVEGFERREVVSNCVLFFVEGDWIEGVLTC